MNTFTEIAPEEGRCETELTSRSWAFAAAGAGTVVAVSTTLPWIHAGLGTRVRSYSGLDVLPLAVPVIAMALLITGVALVEGVWRRTAGMPVTIGASCVATVGAAVLIAVLELAGVLIPSGILPDTIRRVTVDLGADAGLWIGFLGSLVAAVAAAAAQGSLAKNAQLRRLAARSTPRVALLAPVVLLLAILVLAWLRYEPWIEGGAAGQSVELEGFAVPWVGPLSLVALWLMVGGLTAMVLTRGQIGAVLAGYAGWLVTFLAGLSILTSEALARAGLEIAHLHSPQVSFGETRATWAAYAAGILAAGAGALSLKAGTEEVPWTP